MQRMQHCMQQMQHCMQQMRVRAVALPLVAEGLLWRLMRTADSLRE